jgi:hypothetical protein
MKRIREVLWREATSCDSKNRYYEKVGGLHGRKLDEKEMMWTSGGTIVVTVDCNMGR